MIATASNAVNDHAFSQNSSGSAAVLLRPATRRAFAPPFTPLQNTCNGTRLTFATLLLAPNDLMDQPDHLSGCVSIYYDQDGDVRVNGSEADLERLASELCTGTNELGEK